MTPKERARLRGLANGIDTVLQIGKDGIGENLIHQADITLEARELIKGRVLDACMDYTPRTAAETLARATGGEVVQVIGSKFVLYRKKETETPKKHVKPCQRKRARTLENHGIADKADKKPSTPKHGGPRTASALERNGQRKPSASERNGQRKALASARNGQRKPSASERNGQRKALASARNGQRKPSASERNGQRKAAGENAPARRYAPLSPKGGEHGSGPRTGFRRKAAEGSKSGPRTGGKNRK